jgi:hypothetical protein
MIANSLIGRLCSKSEGIIEFTPATVNTPRPQTSALVLKVKGKHHPKPVFLYGKDKQSVVRNNPLWAAEIYSLARITLYNAMITANALWYVDTDCIIAESNKDLDIGNGFGQWKHVEAPIQVYGAKQYVCGSEIVWKGVSKLSEKRGQIAGSLYTQERLDLGDGNTAPYTREEAEGVNRAGNGHFRSRRDLGNNRSNE